MYANRLMRAAPRAQEMVLYDFLARLYESHKARARAQAKKRGESAGLTISSIKRWCSGRSGSTSRWWGRRWS